MLCHRVHRLAWGIHRAVKSLRLRSASVASFEKWRRKETGLATVSTSAEGLLTGFQCRSLVRRACGD